MDVEDTDIEGEGMVIGADLTDIGGGATDGTPCSCRWSWCFVPRC